MIDEYLDLRNKIHQQDFRFKLSSNLWEDHYLSKGLLSSSVEEIRTDGVLRGYAVLEELSADENRICMIRELCADGEKTFEQLLEQIVNRGLEGNSDFIMWRHCEEPFGHLLDRKGFLTMKESAIMMKLFNPKELLRSLSSRTERGKVMRLVIREFPSPLIVRVGRKSLSIIGEDALPQFTVSIDAKTFLRLMFGRASFWREFLSRRVKAEILHLLTAKHFFDLIENKSWYIPSGDWY